MHIHIHMTSVHVRVYMCSHLFAQQQKYSISNGADAIHMYHHLYYYVILRIIIRGRDTNYEVGGG